MHFKPQWNEVACEKSAIWFFFVLFKAQNQERERIFFLKLCYSLITQWRAAAPIRTSVNELGESWDCGKAESIRYNHSNRFTIIAYVEAVLTLQNRTIIGLKYLFTVPTPCYHTHNSVLLKSTS